MKQALHFPLVMTLKEKPKSKKLLIPSHAQLCLSLAPHTMLGWELQVWSLSDTFLLYPGESLGHKVHPSATPDPSPFLLRLNEV